MGDVLSESITLRLAAQTVIGVDAAAGWWQAQVDRNSLQNWKRANETVERNIHDKWMVPRMGNVVGWKVNPSFAHDFNKDFADNIAEPAMRCIGAHPGGKNQRVYRVTGVTATGFTVAANGDLPDNTIVKARGSLVEDNNGEFLTAGAIAAEIKVPGLVVEAAPPANMTVGVVGFEGAAGDIEFDADGNLISTIEDFLLRGIQVGSQIVVGGDTVATRFANVPEYNGWFWVKSVAQHLIELELHTSHQRERFTPAGADDGAGKTIRVYTSSIYRNYAIDDALYSVGMLEGELEEPRAGSDGTTRYSYCEGLVPNTLEISAPLKNKITATLSLVGANATIPVAVADRVGGLGAVAGDSPVKAYEPLGVSEVDTANGVQYARVTDDDGEIVGEVNDWTLTIGNNVSPKEVQGTPGAIGHHVGQFMHTVKIGAYYSDSDQVAAATENRKLGFDVFARNDDYAFAIRLPRVAMRNDTKAFEANTQVRLNFDAPAFGHETTNIAGILCIFEYVPNRRAFE